MEKRLKFTDFLGQEQETTAKLFLYEVSDFMGKKMPMPCVQLYACEDDVLIPYATLTTTFGEYVNIKNCAYIDVNNCSFAPQLLKLGIAKDTGLTRTSGMCVYPLWIFDEDFLKEIGGDEYEKYNEEYEKYLQGIECDECEAEKHPENENLTEKFYKLRVINEHSVEFKIFDRISEGELDTWLREHCDDFDDPNWWIAGRNSELSEYNIPYNEMGYLVKYEEVQ